MNEPEWLLPETVINAHQIQIEKFGGSFGIRDENLLVSAIMRPQNLFAYGKPNIFEMAATLAFGIAKNHPFIDGNKRTAASSAIIFLDVNGWEFNVQSKELVENMVSFAEDKISEKEFAIWLENNSVKM